MKNRILLVTTLLALSTASFGQSTGSINGHAYVDLGLSVMWATCNVGASSPSDYGNYYAWGETSTKSSYTDDNSRTLGKDMGDISGNATYDAARANWGGSWRLPTEEEIDELVDRCDATWTTMNGVEGRKVTGPNGNSIFLPAAGWRSEALLNGTGEYGHYWSSSAYESYTLVARCLLFGDDSFFDRGWGGRGDGLSVRPVSGKSSSLSTSAASKPETTVSSASGTINGYEYVDLGLSVKWAVCNVGASSPSDYGDYYAWGETSTKSSYTEDNYTQYEVSMGDISGDETFDAARANWGGSWRLPTEEEIFELANRCSPTWTTMNGHNGYKVTGPNGNSIFLPAAGERYESSLDETGEYGSYWSSTLVGSDAAYAYRIGFCDGDFLGGYWGDRERGLSVRPVSE